MEKENKTKHIGSVKKKCLICSSEYSVFPYRKESKFCSVICGLRARRGMSKSPSYGHRGKKHSEKSKTLISLNRTGKYTGPENHKWTGGISTYRKIVHIKNCEKCGNEKKLLVHHKDRNRNNNKLENLEVLCSKCHCHEHNHFNRWKK